MLTCFIIHPDVTLDFLWIVQSFLLESSTDLWVHLKIKQNMLALSLYVTLCFSYMSYTYDKTKLRAATCIIPRNTLVSLLTAFVFRLRQIEMSLHYLLFLGYTQSSGLSTSLEHSWDFAGKMLAVFEKAIGNPPEELSLPSTGLKNSKSRQEIAEIFQSLWPESTLYNLSNENFMALSHEDESPLLPRYWSLIDLVHFLMHAWLCHFLLRSWNFQVQAQLIRIDICIYFS